MNDRARVQGTGPAGVLSKRLLEVRTVRAVHAFLALSALPFLLALDTPRELTVPSQGEPMTRILALWDQTRPILIADAGQPLSDADSLARGAPLVEAWSALDASLANTEEAGETHAVLKLINDLYGRPESPPDRRMSIRNDTRRNFAQRLQNVEGRLRR